jgi:hypothetical protein
MSSESELPVWVSKGKFFHDRGGKILRVDYIEDDKICMKMQVSGQEVHPLTEYFDFIKRIEIKPPILSLLLGYRKEWNAHRSHVLHVLCDGRITLIEKSGEWDVALHTETSSPLFLRKIKYFDQLQDITYALLEDNLRFIFNY